MSSKRSRSITSYVDESDGGGKLNARVESMSSSSESDAYSSSSNESESEQEEEQRTRKPPTKQAKIQSTKSLKPAVVAIPCATPKPEITTTKSPTPTRKKPLPKLNFKDFNELPVHIPKSNDKDTDETTILIQIDETADLAGAVGAVGRLECIKDTLILDLKGQRYSGRAYDGPTCMMLGIGHVNGQPHLKVEGHCVDTFHALSKETRGTGTLHAANKESLADNDDGDDSIDYSGKSESEG
ncbi:MAG: hypothetical protein SGARI_005072 [Bacillariaceae sp.]